MERPMMNPVFGGTDDDDGSGNAQAQKRRRIRFGWIWRGVKRVGRLLLTPAISFRRGDRLRVEDGTPFQRFVRGLLYRLAFVPLIVAIFVVALVFAATHPPHHPLETDPLSHGLFIESVTIGSEDGTELKAWLVPAIDAKAVIQEKGKILHKKSPAVVLAHDFGGSRQQLLPLVRPLHEAGIVVLVVGLRGTGSSTSIAQTFGLEESNDVLAAVRMLRQRSFVDPARISVLGIGTGANAALLAAQADPAIDALVLDRPVDGFAEAFRNRIGHDRPWLEYILPVCRWTFEVMYRVDTGGLSLARFNKTLDSRPVLRLATAPGTVPQGEQLDSVVEFLSAHALPRSGAPGIASTSD